jgi:hypothetical protein
MKLYVRIIWLVFLPLTIGAQSYEGLWQGWLSQDGKADTFSYQLTLEQVTTGFSGTSYSAVPSGKASAQFQVVATADGSQLVLQEVQQLEPAKPRWCLKYVQLEWSDEDGTPTLLGRWKADNCTPGTIRLQQQLVQQFDTTTVEVPFSIPGKWTGYLSQSDRDYGFYFELDLDHGQTGQSYIVSEGNGGSAKHRLQWAYDSLTQELQIEEISIDEKSDGDWRWCIKKGKLRKQADHLKYTLEGPWQGYLEGTDGDVMNCAPGTLYLEKPILTTQKILAQKQLAPYKMTKTRPIQIERIIEVQNDFLRIKIWDNGTVDGDVATIFLNGEQIVENLKVTKRKRGFPVTINANGDNFLILHAEDLGDISPNTVAVSIDDGKTEQIIILSSNLEESGALMIRKFRLQSDR